MIILCFFEFFSIVAAILKILKTKCTTLSDDLFLCQVSKGSAVRFPRNVPGKNWCGRKKWNNKNNNNKNKIWYDLKDHLWLPIRKSKIYLETKFCPNRRIFVFWPLFWIKNGRHNKPKWSSHAAAYLTPCKYPFPLKSFHLWTFNNLFLFFLFLYWQPFWIRVITTLPNSEQSYKGKVKTHNYINRKNQSTTGNLWKP